MSITKTSTEETSTPVADRQNAPGPRKSRRRGRGTAVVVVLVVGAGAAGTAYYLVADPFHRNSAATTISNGSKTGLAPIITGDLSARSMQTGTLGYAGDYQVINKTSGSLTSLPNVGDIVRQGHALYRVDGTAVILLQGADVPAYRALARGSQGADVKQLNAALVALGYAKKSKLDAGSDLFGRQTSYALKRLQNKLGLKKTGNLPLGQAVFVPTPEIRITKVNGVLGTQAGPNQAIVEASSTNRQVAVELNATQQTTVNVGNHVTITLPTGDTTPGQVTSVGKVATKTDTSTTIEVLIKPLKPKQTGQLDQAPVQVSIVSETAKTVLSVPVNALLALAGGGYAVEVVDAGGVHRLVAVKTGLFDDSAGRVEVSGTGLSAGQNVVVPTS